MSTIVQKWGDSLAVRLPAPMLEQVGLSEGAEVDVRVEGRALVIKQARLVRRIEEVLAGVPPEGFGPEEDWGPPVGREVW